LKSKDYPLLNRAIQSAYSPGSIFKIVTASAGLESSKINRNTVMDCRGAYALGNREFACWIEEGHGPLDLRHALMGSCNVYFYKLGKMLGEFEIARFAYQFGLGRPTGIDLPGETSGLVPDRRWKRAKTGEQWYEGDTINLAIGQGYLLATPAQALVMVNAVANEGGVITPYIVHSIDTVQMQGPRIKDIGVSKKNLEVVKRGLFMAVDRSAGTGIRARVPGLKVAGKTGTAQAGSGEPHAWFTGYAPADDPKVSLVIFLENGGYAGEEAAPIAGKIFRKLRDMKLL